jgi:hypothetical protein
MTSNHDLDLFELCTLSTQDVAGATRIPIETVWSAAKSGSLYGRKLGREWRFTISAVREWIGLSPNDQTVRRRDARAECRLVRRPRSCRASVTPGRRLPPSIEHP